MHSKPSSASKRPKGSKRRKPDELSNQPQPASDQAKQRPPHSAQSLGNLQPDSLSSQRGGSRELANDVERVSDTDRRGGQRTDDGSVERPGEV
jgi:hypothetical protein